MRDPKSDPTARMFAEACAMLKQAEQLQRQFFGPSSAAGSACWEPPVDIFETEREVTVITALPGVRPEAVRAEIEGTTLIVTGVRAIPAAGRGANIVRLEIPYGRFERRIAISSRLRLIGKELENGCLKLIFTKAG
ncbi:Hsp20/alpha crystallin family protein [Methyloceanibacter sp. wino2]|uniref:Hsp20/alpha crystallin family protein n=1 Tax=Methyloceanibacter sp. wino2 TaxID=2170729 RepID=UPI001ABA4C0B|nr:Hsp20/alpha crystallin family protein [Methyloceanibacter sp. wino2]